MHISPFLPLFMCSKSASIPSFKGHPLNNCFRLITVLDSDRFQFLYIYMYIHIYTLSVTFNLILSYIISYFYLLFYNLSARPMIMSFITKFPYVIHTSRCH